MTPDRLVALAALGSAVLLGGAFVFQMLGYAPCQMCIWQRYPHAVAVGAGIAIAVLGGRWFMLVGAAAAATTAAIGFYHAGVEQDWWQGPSTCSAGPIDALSTDDLLNQILTAPLVRCDDIPWQMFGLSMAAWNAILSLMLFAVWISAFRRG